VDIAAAGEGIGLVSAKAKQLTTMKATAVNSAVSPIFAQLIARRGAA
jgi:hypothetical protein